MSTPPPAQQPGRAILLVDGDCALCTSLVHFAASRDRAARLRYGTLQSDTGRSLLRQHGHPSDYMSSAVLIEYGEPGARAGAAPGSGGAKAGRCTTHSTAALRLLLWFEGWWWRALARAFLLVPRQLRNVAYSLVSRLRYRLWGHNPRCELPAQWLHRRIVAATLPEPGPEPEPE